MMKIFLIITVLRRPLHRCFFLVNQDRVKKNGAGEFSEIQLKIFKVKKKEKDKKSVF